MNTYPRSIRRLDELLSEHMQLRGYGQSLSHDEIADVWAKVVEVPLQQYARAGKVSRGVLEIFVSNSTAMQELKFREATLIRDLQAHLPRHGISRLRFKISSSLSLL